MYFEKILKGINFIAVLGAIYLIISIGIYFVHDTARINSLREACKTKNIHYGQVRKVVSGFYQGQKVFVENYYEFSLSIKGRIEGSSTVVDINCIELE